MNDLFSTTSLKNCKDKEVHFVEMESGLTGDAAAKETVNLDKFFEDVENVKDDMRGLEKLYQRLRDANEESKTVHSGDAVKEIRSRMDSDIGQVLRKAKAIKGKLEALDKANAQNRTVSGCGPGSSADRTRTSVVGGLGKKLKDLMDDFQGLRARINDEYKETIGRRYFTVTGTQADEETIENLISSGQSESFMQKAIQEQGRGQVMDTIAEMQERHDAVKEIEKSLLDLHQVFLDMAALVDAQGHQLNDIESQVVNASSFVRRGTTELEVAREHQKGTRKWTCIAIMLFVLLLMLVLFPMLPTIMNLRNRYNHR